MANSSNTTPLAMAAANARDKLQASAREWIRNLEEAISQASQSGSGSSSSKSNNSSNRRRQDKRGSKAGGSLETSQCSSSKTTAKSNSSNSIRDSSTSIENAFRVMFASCTTGADMVMKSVPSRDLSESSQPLPSSSSSPSMSRNASQNSKSNSAEEVRQSPPTSLYPSFQNHPPPPPPQQQRRSNPAQSNPLLQQQQQQQYQRLQQSRQRLIQHQQNMVARQQQPIHAENQGTLQPVTAGAAKTAEYGEQIYAQLFYDDQVGGQNVNNSNMFIPKPFPVSSPLRTNPVPAYYHPQMPLQSEELNIPLNRTFDDAISAISAQTLENMVQHELTRQNRSGESSLFPASTGSGSPKVRVVSPDQQKQLPLKAAVPAAPALPFGYPRVRSNNSSKNNDSLNDSIGKHSVKSRSTRTTSSSTSFEQWQQSEAQLWKLEVMAEEEEDPGPTVTPKARERKDPKRSKSRELSKAFDPAVSSPTALSPWSAQSPSKHPHETLFFDSTDFWQTSTAHHHRMSVLQSDPDRLQSVLLMPEDTEMAEI